jgi:hypothetical protein
MSHKSASSTAVGTIGIDLGKNSFHLVGLDQRGAIVLQLKCSRAQLERRLANIPSCLIGMEACSGAHYIGRQLATRHHCAARCGAVAQGAARHPELKYRRGVAKNGQSHR